MEKKYENYVLQITICSQQIYGMLMIKSYLAEGIHNVKCNVMVIKNLKRVELNTKIATDFLNT